MAQSPLLQAVCWGALIFATLGAGYSSLLLVVSPWLSRRQFARRPDRDQETEWRFSAETVRVRSKIESSEFVWTALARVVRKPEGFLLVPAENMMHWLPRHGFASEEDFERLSQLAQAHALDFRRISR